MQCWTLLRLLFSLSLAAGSRDAKFGVCEVFIFLMKAEQILKGCAWSMVLAPGVVNFSIIEADTRQIGLLRTFH